MKQPAIIAIGYNRPESIKRLLNSIAKADYGDYTDIQLIISIDGGGGSNVREIASGFEWVRGEKTIIEHPENLGLRKHILSCGDLSEKYGSVIILEDDCLVSKNFYLYSTRAIEFYHTDKRIAGIGLYSFQYNENAYLPFSPLIDGNDVYFMQVPCSFGQAWTSEQWSAFKAYYNAHVEITDDDLIPVSVKSWPESSWKKYFAKYMAEKNKYFVYPQVSYSTNFADPGEHWNNNLTFFQVQLEHQITPDFKFIPFDDSQNKYDAYFEMLPDCLIYHGAKINEDTSIDIFGTKNMDRIQHKFLLSSRVSNNPRKTFGVCMRPLWQNIIQEDKGDIFNYALTDTFSDTIPESLKFYIWEKQQPQGYYHATRTKYYKLGYYLLHPLRFIKKRLKK
ncbi:MAG: glycosyltransferase family A protein [Bacteroidota bacterium]